MQSRGELGSLSGFVRATCRASIVACNINPHMRGAPALNSPFRIFATISVASGRRRRPAEEGRTVLLHSPLGRLPHTAVHQDTQSAVASLQSSGSLPGANVTEHDWMRLWTSSDHQAL